jgi:hypothetical protein
VVPAFQGTDVRDPELHQGEVDHGELGAIGEQHHGAVTLFHAVGKEPVG